MGIGSRKKLIKPKVTPANKTGIRTALRQGKILTATKKTSAKDRKLSWKKGSELKKRLAERKVQFAKHASRNPFGVLSAVNAKRLTDLRKRISKLNLKGFTNETLEKRTRTLINDFTKQIRLNNGLPLLYSQTNADKHANKLLADIRRSNNLEDLSNKISLIEIREYAQLEFRNALTIASANFFRGIEPK